MCYTFEVANKLLFSALFICHCIEMSAFLFVLQIQKVCLVESLKASWMMKVLI